MVQIILEPVNAESIPNELYTCLRVGDIQKFSKGFSKRNYDIAAKSVGDRRFGKLDIYKRVGTATINVDPESNKGVTELSMKLDDPLLGDIKYRLEVLASANNKPVEKPAIRERGDSYNEKVKAVKDYVEIHQLEARLHEAMQAALRDRPEDPASFIAAKLTSGAGMVKKLAGKDQAPPSPAAPAPATPAQQAAPAPAAPIAPTAEAAAVAPAPAPAMSPEAVPQSAVVAETTCQILKARAFSDFQKAADDGRLRTTLLQMDAREQFRRKVMHTLSAAVMDESFLPIARFAKDMVTNKTALRHKARETLKDAMTEHDQLQQVLEDAKKMETLRVKAKQMLFEAAGDNCLSNVVYQARRPDHFNLEKMALRGSAKELLIQGLRGGLLEDTVKQMADMETLRQKSKRKMLSQVHVTIAKNDLAASLVKGLVGLGSVAQ